LSNRDYYEILGVPKSAEKTEIKKAYRKLAQKFHPDKNPDNPEAEAKFKEASEAYSVVGDDSKRAKYDQFGHAAFSAGAGGGGGFSGFNSEAFNGFEDVFGDLFGSFFGGGSSSSASRGRDLKYDLEVTLEEAAFGIEKNINITRNIRCSDCSGSGAKKGTKPVTCNQCRGQGQVRVQQGFFTVNTACPACSGSGQTIKNPCLGCSGSGLKLNKSTIKVKVPAGIDTGQRLKLTSEGDASKHSGAAGDLYVVMHVKKHSVFERHDNDLFLFLDIPYTIAALGSEIKVPTLDGEVNMKIPSGTQNGKIFRLKNKGIKILGTSSRGDQHVKVNVKVPSKISDEHRKMLEKLEEVQKEDLEKDSKSFFNRVKSMFA